MTDTVSTDDKPASMPVAGEIGEYAMGQFVTNSRHGYQLRLADGRGWHFVGTEKAQPFLDRLATILNLKPSGGKQLPKVVFSPAILELDGSPSLSCLSREINMAGPPASPWARHAFGPLRVWLRDGRGDLVCELDTDQTRSTSTEAIIAMWFVITLLYRQVQSFRGLPVHGALLGWQDMGVVLAGPGGIGKSTCSNRVPPPWHSLCDDETLMVRNEQGYYVAHPFPTWSQYLWNGSGSRGRTEDYLPVSAICFLKRGPYDQMTAVPQAEAAVHLYQSAAQVHTRIWPYLKGEETMHLKRQLFDNACQIVENVPAYELQLSAGGAFWKKLEKVLEHEG